MRFDIIVFAGLLLLLPHAASASSSLSNEESNENDVISVPTLLNDGNHRELPYRYSGPIPYPIGEDFCSLFLLASSECADDDALDQYPTFPGICSVMKSAVGGKLCRPASPPLCESAPLYEYLALPPSLDISPGNDIDSFTYDDENPPLLTLDEVQETCAAACDINSECLGFVVLPPGYFNGGDDFWYCFLKDNQNVVAGAVGETRLTSFLRVISENRLSLCRRTMRRIPTEPITMTVDALSYEIPNECWTACAEFFDTCCCME